MGFYQKFEDLIQETSKSSALASFLKYEKDFLYFEKIEGEPAFELKNSSSKWEGDSKIARLYESDPSFEWNLLKTPLKVQAFKPFLKMMPSENVYAEPLCVEGSITSVFFLHKKNEETLNLLKALSLKCESFQREKKYKELFTESSFLQNLYAEIFRSRRLKLPVSCILIECMCTEGESEESNAQIKTLLKFVKNHLAKHSQVYDVILPVSRNQLGLILPHTFESLALKKAEKFYSALKSLEDLRILKYPMKFKMTVSEYPKSARDALGLLNLMRQALSQSKGLCIAQAAQGFQPDFRPSGDLSMLDENRQEDLSRPPEEASLQTSI